MTQNDKTPLVYRIQFYDETHEPGAESYTGYKPINCTSYEMLSSDKILCFVKDRLIATETISNWGRIEVTTWRQEDFDSLPKAEATKYEELFGITFPPVGGVKGGN